LIEQPDCWQRRKKKTKIDGIYIFSSRMGTQDRWTDKGFPRPTAAEEFRKSKIGEQQKQHSHCFQA
jgi:hypothetical protein